MDSYKPKNGAVPIQSYNASKQIPYGCGLLFVIMLIGFASIVSYAGGFNWLILLLLACLLLIIWILSLLFSQTELNLYEDGLEYRINKTHYFSDWEDMQHFEIRSSGKNQFIGIHCLEVKLYQEGNRLENFLLKDADKHFMPLHIVTVPTRSDGCWGWQVVDTEKLVETKFGQELLHYAPQLFEDSTEKAKNS